ncbi:ATP-binding protein [Pleomorphomonas sp. NRK KF1]|uniref:sensor histidine kinase n=1 Tax=Pleomorphomonas sp. NRK KF1 TaxID=2943000 RepID=UPI0020436BC3|nr:ATP-binding protein [Pleomorphomonas sp. NRK KF1]MCM5553425.1 ATP-binding protein [Pleomorphomonas sp. NRK KF1]
MTQRHAQRSLALLLPAILILALAMSFVGFKVSEDTSIARLAERGRQRLDLYETSLEREIDKYAFFPATLGLERDVVDLLVNGGEEQASRINNYLAELNKRAGSLSIYLLSSSGHVVATSNWNQPDSFLGEDLSYRPYFRDALAKQTGRFFGIGTTRSQPGYYLSSPILADERLLGVAVVKVSLEQLETSWSTVEAPVLVTDENGVVILASVPSWKFTTLTPLSEERRSELAQSLHYNARPLPPLGLQSQGNVSSEKAEIVQLVRPAAEEPHTFPIYGVFLAQSAPLKGTNWRLTVLSPFGDLRTMAWLNAALAAAGGVILCIASVALYLRRLRQWERLRAREALQRAHDELERKVEERTRTLKEAQEELVHAGKLAVIGQMSAGLAHELNQPLAALHTLSDNTVKFMQRGMLEEAGSNLALISDLVTHMGTLTSQLKSFARKSSGKPRPVNVRRSLENTLFFLNRRLSQRSIRPEINVEPADLSVLADSNRLEQILVNLVANALDATEGVEAPRIGLSARMDGDRVFIEVRDNGPGFGENERERLFEPFFTTKDSGGGLGLGLAISAGIARDFGGSLSAANLTEGGALFVLDLPLATASENVDA